jgi:hypothetical protein
LLIFNLLIRGNVIEGKLNLSKLPTFYTHLLIFNLLIRGNLLYLTLVLFHVFQHLWLLTWRILVFFCPEIFDLDPDKSRGRFDFMQALVAIVLVCIHAATRLFV